MLKDAEKAAALFKDMAGFWKEKKVEDATKWSKESAEAAMKIAGQICIYSNLNLVVEEI